MTVTDRIVLYWEFYHVVVKLCLWNNEPMKNMGKHVRTSGFINKYHIIEGSMIYYMLQGYLMRTYPWSYAEYLTQQLLMNYPVSVIWKR